MKIRTVEQLNQALSDDFSWRRLELSNMRALVSRPSENDVFIRSGVAIMYAHWEGFVKRASTCYLEFINRQGLSYKQLASNIIALAFRGRLNAATESNKIALYVSVIDDITTGMDQKCVLPWERVINTKSNLSSRVLREIISMLGLDYGPYITKEYIVDEQLLAARNNIAHGEWLTISLSQYESLHYQVLELMSLFRAQVDTAASNGQWRK